MTEARSWSAPHSLTLSVTAAPATRTPGGLTSRASIPTFTPVAAIRSTNPWRRTPKSIGSPGLRSAVEVQVEALGDLGVVLGDVGDPDPGERLHPARTVPAA